MNILRQKEVKWSAQEHLHIERGIGWFVGVGLFSLFFIILAIVQGNPFFALFIIIAFGLIVFFAMNEPEYVEFKINEKGVFVKNKFYSFKEFEGFAYRDLPGRKDEIVLKRKTYFNPIIKMPIDVRVAKRALEILKEKIKEIEHEETLIELLSEWLGF